MSRKTLVGHFARSIRRLRRSKRGNVLMTFALSIIPVIGFVGAAVDYSRANSAKAAMQAAIDSTGLMLSKEAQSLTNIQLSTKAADYFNALFLRPDVTNVTLTQTFSTPTAGSFKLQLVATGKMPSTFSRVFGQDYLNIDVSTQIVWGMKKLELALALDNTGSMASNNKMTELKKAAKSLLATLKTAAKTPGDVKVAIIPFDITVRIDTSYNTNLWYDINSALDCNGPSSGLGCTTTNWKNVWTGCVRDRTYPYDVQDNPPTIAIPDTLYPIDECGSIAVAMPLSSDWTALNAKIDQMTPNGNTNVTIGLVWAWHALTAGVPFTEAAAPSPDLEKVIIILTDGTNTESWKNSNSTRVTSSSAIDARAALACSNIKAANIKIYAIRVIDGNANLLRNCATNPTMYFDVQNAGQLGSVFSAIAQNLANLRISK